jgi:hypothetical protein
MINYEEFGFVPPLAGEARRGIDNYSVKSELLFIPPLTPPARGRTKQLISEF